jgi:hypothetical protein
MSAVNNRFQEVSNSGLGVKVIGDKALQAYVLIDQMTYSRKYEIASYMVLGTAFAVSLLPESVQAANLGDQIDSLQALTVGKFKTYGVSLGTICGVAFALFNGNLKLVAMIVFIGVVLSYYLSWIAGGMVIA